MIITSSIALLIISAVTFITFQWKRLHAISNLFALKKRYLFLIYLELSLIIIYLIFERLVFIIDLQMRQSGMFPSIQRVVYYTHVIAYPLTFHGILLIIIIRMWHLYYDLHCNQITAESKWKCILNPSLCSDANWFIKNKNKFGNYRYTLKYILFPIYAIDATIGLYVYMFSSSSMNIIFYEFPYHIISNFIIWIFYYHIPAQYDTIYIRIELKYSCIVYTLFFIFIGSAYLILLFVFNDFYIRSTVDIVLYTLGIIALLVPTLIIIPNKIRNEFGILTPRKDNLRERIRSETNSEQTTADISENGSIESVSIRLIELFKWHNCFELFMDHLQREMSSEHLLSLIELVQFKQTLSKVMKCGDCLGENQILNELVDSDCFYFGFPASMIVSKYMDKIGEMDEVVLLACFTTKYRSLFDKYIANGAEYEVNISHLCRSPLYAMMECLDQNVNVTLSDLNNVFDDVIVELYVLLNDPYTRFKKHKCWEKVAQTIVNHKTPSV